MGIILKTCRDSAKISDGREKTVIGPKTYDTPLSFPSGVAHEVRHTNEFQDFSSLVMLINSVLLLLIPYGQYVYIMSI